MKKTKESEVLRKVREERGYILPLYEVMAELDPHLLELTHEYTSYILVSRQGKALDNKTRALVFIGIAVAVKTDREGIEVGIRRAKAAGASDAEIIEAMLLAGLPAGFPAAEYAARVWKEMREGHALVDFSSEEHVSQVSS
jgi:alkylhydroperoxidase/carboxymuconolactone decarboxylase family protein YurZ